MSFFSKIYPINIFNKSRTYIKRAKSSYAFTFICIILGWLYNNTNLDICNIFNIYNIPIFRIIFIPKHLDKSGSN